MGHEIIKENLENVSWLNDRTRGITVWNPKIYERCKHALGLSDSLVLELTESSDWCWVMVKEIRKACFQGEPKGLLIG